MSTCYYIYSTKIHEYTGSGATFVASTTASNAPRVLVDLTPDPPHVRLPQQEMIRAAHCYPADSSLRENADFDDDWATYKERHDTYPNLQNDIPRHFTPDTLAPLGAI